MNPRHPLIRELRRRVEADDADQTTIDLALVMYDTAILRSGYALKDSSNFASRIERMLRLGMNVDLDAKVCVGSVEQSRVGVLSYSAHLKICLNVTSIYISLVLDWCSS